VRTRIRNKTFKEFSDDEINAGLAHSKTKYVITLDFDHLRTLANEVGKRRDPKVILPMFVGDVARDGFLRQRDINEAARFEAYRGAVCKMFSDRSGRKRHRAAVQRRENQQPRTVTRPASPTYPVNAKTGQYRML
jgi:hypothetical protein